MRELGEIGEYIARDKPAAANRWVEVLMTVAEQAAAMPLAGRQVPEYGRDDLLVYLVTDTQVEIATVRDGHRQMPKRLR